MSQAYHNGALVSSEGLSVSVHDFGFCRGYAVYELARVYGQCIFHVDLHVDRLMASLKSLDISIPFSALDIKNQMQDLVRLNGYDHSTVKVYVTQGEPNLFHIGIGANMNFKPQLFVMNEKLSIHSEEFPVDEKYYREGLKIATVDFERTVPEAKTTNYIAAIKAGRDAMSKGYDDILFVNRHKQVTECSRNNIFFVKEGVLITPESDMLGGVTRYAILEVAKKLRLPVEVRCVPLTEVNEMDEAFVSSSVIEVMGIKRIDGHRMGVGDEAPVTKEITKAFKEYVAKEVVSSSS